MFAIRLLQDRNLAGSTCPFIIVGSSSRKIICSKPEKKINKLKDIFIGIKENGDEY